MERYTTHHNNTPPKHKGNVNLTSLPRHNTTRHTVIQASHLQAHAQA